MATPQLVGKRCRFKPLGFRFLSDTEWSTVAGLDGASSGQAAIFVLTDIENEPDDAMSMVRLLVYANQFDIEGLAATTSVHQRNRIAPDRIRSIVQAYAQVRDNLEKHERDFRATST